MKRVLVPCLDVPGALVSPGPDEAHHLIRVRRVAVGESVELLDGLGGLALGEVAEVTKRELTIKVVRHLEQDRESPLWLTLVAALPQQLSTLDGVLPSLVQQGLNRLILVPTEFGGSVKKDPGKYLDRLNSIALQALKQCGRVRVPSIELAADLAGVIAGLADEHQLVLMLHPVPERLSQGLPARPESLAVLVGPEGGFSEAELALATAAGIVVRGLGPRILKMETALAGICFWAQDRFGDA